VDSLHAALKKLEPRHSIYLEEKGREGVVLSSEANTVDHIANHAGFQVTCASDPCVLVVNLAKIGGWHAFSDSVPIEIHTANFAFLSVNVPRGKHLIWFEHERAFEVWGMYISIFTGLLFLAFFRARADFTENYFSGSSIP
jgi:uncharacterized membrane protein YfhO